MPGKLLIVDSIATNRIVLKVRLTNAVYEVLQAENAADAQRVLAKATPDLILINVQLDDCDSVDFCKLLRDQKQTAFIPIVLITSEDDRTERLRALKSGANDVLVRPMDEVVLLARLRSLLRSHESVEENQLRERTNEALGFAEPSSAFTPRSSIHLATPEAATSVRWASLLKPILPYKITSRIHGDTLKDISHAPSPDVFVIAVDPLEPEPGLRLVAEIRARTVTRHAGILVMLEQEDRETVVDAMDLGASDVMLHGFDADELSLRVSNLVSQKRFSDNLRANLTSGLQAAVTDPLTGLFNRRYAMPHLSRLQDQAMRKGRQFAVLLADLDHFKAVNDQFGHAAGDEVLSETARRMREHLRAIDLVARIGGEEFLIVLSETNLERSQATASRLCALLRDRPIPLTHQSSEVPITMSVGVTMGGKGYPDLPVEDLLRQADKALYEAKALGRDQVCISKLAA
ncbi:diguanylate cyclase [Cognatishimia activa]|uniref:diguanylate cyclase n=1 Tax=Cognatishimia activa TaxID=1715691 RepID=UPI00223240BB|nr:diguanylate cyclase [Cognatishimia activa]UZD91550.1 diguanylate cyclase [Cognatishimia activa]